MLVAGGAAAASTLLPWRAPLQGSAGVGALAALTAGSLLFNPAKSWHWHRAVELLVLCPFVCLQLMAAVPGMAVWPVLGVPRVGAWAPLLGGVAGAAMAAALLAVGRALVGAAGNGGNTVETSVGESASGEGGYRLLQILRRLLLP